MKKIIILLLLTCGIITNAYAADKHKSSAGDKLLKSIEHVLRDQILDPRDDITREIIAINKTGSWIKQEKPYANIASDPRLHEQAQILLVNSVYQNLFTSGSKTKVFIGIINNKRFSRRAKMVIMNGWDDLGKDDIVDIQKAFRAKENSVPHKAHAHTVPPPNKHPALTHKKPEIPTVHQAFAKNEARITKLEKEIEHLKNLINLLIREHHIHKSTN